jgi:hypothetical protein
VVAACGTPSEFLYCYKLSSNFVVFQDIWNKRDLVALLFSSQNCTILNHERPLLEDVEWILVVFFFLGIDHYNNSSCRILKVGASR